MFADYELPVAYSMVKLANQLTEQVHPIEAFTCYWAAFNNIYVTIAEQAGRYPQLRKNPDGSLRTRTIANVSIPEIRRVTEREQMEIAFSQFPDVLKDRLIDHSSTKYFVYRTPSWRGQPIYQDAYGQSLNGVLNVGHTVDPNHPVWTPIDTLEYERYLEYAQEADRVDALAFQILNVLYTIRNNTFHGGKRADDANDRMVLKKALPLLEMIVKTFVQTTDIAI